MKKYDNYVSHLRVLERADQEMLDNEFIISGIIDKFSIIKEAYAVYPFFDGEVWLDMLRDRNDMAHIYDGNAARELVGRILKGYIPAFVKLEEELNEKYGTTLNTL